MDIDLLRNGDILLFSSTTTLFDRAISYFTSSPYTHVAMVLRDPPGHPGLHIIESSVEPTKDEVNDKHIFGVQMQPLVTALENNGSVVCRRLDCHADVTLDSETVWAAISGVYARPYDVRPLDWLRAEVRVLDPKVIWEQQADSFWCSALVAYLYVKLGLLPKNLPWTLVSPEEWGRPSGETALPFIDCELAEPQSIITQQ